MNMISPWSLPGCVISGIRKVGSWQLAVGKLIMNSNRYKYSILPLIIIFLTGCAGLDQKQSDVKVTLVNLQMLESTLLEQRFILSLRVQNRSPQSLSIHGMSFDIEVNGKDFASGTSDQKTTIEAFTDELIEVKMSSTLFGIIRQIQAMQQKQDQSLSYVISGRIYNGDLFGITFREADEFDFSQQSDL